MDRSISLELAVSIAFKIACSERVAFYTDKKMPDRADTWKLIKEKLGKEKMAIDSEAGDLFTKVCHEYGVRSEFPTFVQQYFKGHE